MPYTHAERLDSMLAVGEAVTVSDHTFTGQPDRSNRAGP
jgi:hypothetical protein